MGPAAQHGRAPLAGALLASQKRAHVGADDMATLEVGATQVGADDFARPPVVLDERRPWRSPAECLDPGRAAAGEEIQERPVERAVGLERGEERLLDSICERPRSGRRRLEPHAACRAGDDASLFRHRRPQRGIAARGDDLAGADATQPADRDLSLERGTRRGQPATLVEQLLGQDAGALRQLAVSRRDRATRRATAAGRSA